MGKLTDKQWEEYLKQTEHLLRRYSVLEPQQRAMCDIIAQLPEKAVVVELGTSYGLTAGLFLLSGQNNHIQYTGIDDFSLESTYQPVYDGLSKLELPFTLIANKTQDVPWDTPIDFLFIDAGHDEANVKADCEKWIPFVKSKGYVAFHDWNGSEDKQYPHWAVDHYGRLATEDWEKVAYVGGQLMIKRKP